MGLDMYLNVRKYVSRVNWEANYETSEVPQFRDIVRASNLEGLVSDEGYYGLYVEVPVYYWRKANAIHKWFVDSLADGVDNCQQIGVSLRDLENLVEACDMVIKHPKDARDYLPTESGFFFGSTDYDEYYHGQIIETRDAMRKLIDNMREIDEDWLVYQASW